MKNLLLLTEEQSVWAELWDYFVNNFFSIEYREYENLQFSSSMFTLRSMIICMFIGILLASLLALFNKRVLGDFVRAIAREEATEPGKAMTLEQLGFQKNSAVRAALKHHGSLRRVVRCVEDDQADVAAGVPLRPGIAELYGEIELMPNAKGSGKTNLNGAHFFIPQAEIYTAEIRYEKKGTNWLVFLATLVVCIAAIILLFKLMPDILQLVDNFITMVTPEGNILQ